MELLPKPPSNLKIPQPDFPNPLDVAKKFEKILCEGKKDEGSKSTSIMPVEILPVAYEKETLAIVINIWRIKSRMTDAFSKHTKEELAKEDIKKIARNLESIYDSFTHLGIEIIDRTGESFDYGLPEKVVTAKPQDGITKELVLETLRPTIKWNKQIFPGEVEIVTPISKNDKGES